MPLPPDFQFLPAEPSDVPALVSAYFAAFDKNAHSRNAWPRIPSVRKGWEDMLAHECTEAHSHIYKIIDTTNGRVAAFGKWNEPRYDVDINTQLPEWPDGSNKELNNEFFGKLAQKRIDIMGPKEDHWNLEMIATHPDYQRKGLGSVLLEWGTSRADERGEECYLDASEEGLPLYRKFGFIQKDPARDRVEVDIKGETYWNLCMVRPKQLVA